MRYRMAYFLENNPCERKLDDQCYLGTVVFLVNLFCGHKLALAVAFSQDVSLETRAFNIELLYTMYRYGILADILGILGLVGMVLQQMLSYGTLMTSLKYPGGFSAPTTVPSVTVLVLVDSETESVVQQNKRLRELIMCIRCETRPREVVYIPCGHILYCGICDNLKYHTNCPNCHTRIRGAVYMEI